MYQKYAKAPNASQKNDSGELSLKGFEVQGSRFKVQGSRFKVQGSGFRVQGSGFRVQGSGFKVQGSRFKGFRWRLRRILDDGIPVSSAFPSRGRCPEGADRALAAGKTDEKSREVHGICGKSVSHSRMKKISRSQ